MPDAAAHDITTVASPTAIRRVFKALVELLRNPIQLQWFVTVHRQGRITVGAGVFSVAVSSG
jgi:molybdopterin synthase catalytic subunit